MKAVYCPYCGGRTKRNGRTSSGSQRWGCTACGASTTLRYDDTAARLEEFLGWLLSKDSQATMPGGGRSFRRRTAEFWEVWPMPVPDGELHRVLYVDGIWVARDLVVLICCSGDKVVSWYMARSEDSRAWSALMAPIPAPKVVVTDLPLLWGIGAAGDMSSMSAYFATVFRLTWSTRAISDLERPAASIDRISFTVSRGTVISSILPGRARQSNRPGKPYGEGRAPGPRGAALLLILLNFSCSRRSFPSDHSDHFLVNINTSDPSSTDMMFADTVRGTFVGDLLFGC